MAFKMKGFPFSGSALKQDDSKKLVKGSTMVTTPSQRQKTQNLKKNIPGVNIRFTGPKTSLTIDASKPEHITPTQWSFAITVKS